MSSQKTRRQEQDFSWLGMIATSCCRGEQDDDGTDTTKSRRRLLSLRPRQSQRRTLQRDRNRPTLFLLPGEARSRRVCSLLSDGSLRFHRLRDRELRCTWLKVDRPQKFQAALCAAFRSWNKIKWGKLAGTLLCAAEMWETKLGVACRLLSREVWALLQRLFWTGHGKPPARVRSALLTREVVSL